MLNAATTECCVVRIASRMEVFPGPWPIPSAIDVQVLLDSLERTVHNLKKTHYTPITKEEKLHAQLATVPNSLEVLNYLLLLLKETGTTSTGTFWCTRTVLDDVELRSCIAR